MKIPEADVAEICSDCTASFHSCPGLVCVRCDERSRNNGSKIKLYKHFHTKWTGRNHQLDCFSLASRRTIYFIEFLTSTSDYATSKILQNDILAPIFSIREEKLH